MSCLEAVARRRERVALTVLLLALVSAACGRSPTAPGDPLAGGVVATFDVSGERFSVWITDPATIRQVLDLRDGRSAASIPNGRLRRGAGQGSHNAPWAWHLDPEDIAMAEVSIEVCDGRPSYVAANLDDLIATVGRYCPWSARLVGVRDLR